MQTIQDLEQPGDLLVFCDFPQPEAFTEYYYKGVSPVVRLIQDGDQSPVNAIDVIKNDRLSDQRKRFWVICSGGRPLCRLLMPELNRGAQRLKFAGGVVVWLIPANPGGEKGQSIGCAVPARSAKLETF
jgi:hypothetical protein